MPRSLHFATVTTALSMAMACSDESGDKVAYEVLTETICPGGISLDAGDLIWVEGSCIPFASSIHIMNLEDEVVRTLIDQDDVGVAVADGAYVYWSNTHSDTIHRVMRTGGDRELVATALEGGLFRVLLDETHVYWQTSHSIWRTPRDTQAQEQFVPGINHAGGFGIANDRLYWVDTTPGDIKGLSLTDGDITTLVSRTPPMYLLVVAEEHVYWNSCATPCSHEEGMVKRAALEGGSLEIVATGQPGPGRVAADESHVYWPVDGKIMRASTAGDSIEVFAEGLENPTAIAIDDTHVYWTNRGYQRGSLMRWPK